MLERSDGSRCPVPATRERQQRPLSLPARQAAALALGFLLVGGACAPAPEPTGPAPEMSAVVLQSDFGPAVMHGIVNGVSKQLFIDDISHDIPDYDIAAAARSLNGTAPYWPPGTVFVSVVDPGVGTPRKSVVLKTTSGHYFVSPDNGTLSMVAETLGIDAVREIDESVNRREGTGWSHTFHGRDVYSFTAARLAAGIITYDEVGPLLEPEVTTLPAPYPEARVEDGVAYGHIRGAGGGFGNVSTNIDLSVFQELGLEEGELVRVTIRNGETTAYDATIPYVRTFGEVELGEPLMLVNSSHTMGFARNQDNFTEAYGIRSGADWSVEIRAVPTGG